MGRFNKILVAASPGKLEASILGAAMKLAHDNGAHLTVLDVVSPVPRSRRTVEVDGRTVDIEVSLRRDREERLQRLVHKARGGPSTEVIVTIGEPWIEVIRHVLTHGHDLVMVGEHGPSEGNKPQLDSGVMQLLRKCPIPVWVMRPSRARKLRILALVDPDPTDPVRDGLNDLVLQLATSLASRQDGELHVGHAWSLPYESTLRLSPFLRLPGSEVDAMARTLEATRRAEIDVLAARHHVSELGASIHLVSGDPRQVLPQLARKLRIGLIVMGTVARTGLPGLFMGNTAETIVRSVDCSVLGVKPKGFVTPVKL